MRRRQAPQPVTLDWHYCIGLTHRPPPRLRFLNPWPDADSFCPLYDYALPPFRDPATRTILAHVAVAAAGWDDVMAREALFGLACLDQLEEEEAFDDR